MIRVELADVVVGVGVHGRWLVAQQTAVEVDVFAKEGKYYLVPIYVADFAKEELPNRAIVALKQFDERNSEELLLRIIFCK